MEAFHRHSTSQLSAPLTSFSRFCGPFAAGLGCAVLWLISNRQVYLNGFWNRGIQRKRCSLGIFRAFSSEGMMRAHEL